MAGKYKGLLMDNDGTMVDSVDVERVATIVAMQECFNLEIPTSQLEKVNVSKSVYETYPEIVKSIQNRILTAEEIQQVVEVHYRNFYERAVLVRKYYGVYEMLDRVHNAKIKIGVVTTRGGAINKMYKALNMDGLFDTVITGDMVPKDRRKPDPLSVEMAMEAMELRPEETLFVGDTIYDMEAGRRAGVDTAHVTWGYGDSDSVREAAPTYTIDHVHQLTEILLGQGIKEYDLSGSKEGSRVWWERPWGGRTQDRGAD